MGFKRVSRERLALATARAPAVPLIVVVVALLALVVGLVTPGVFR